MDPGEVIGNRRYLLQAVGTSQFQNELELIVGARTKESAHYHAKAFLVPEEPKNPNDPDAIQVQIEDYLVGYLDRRTASEYRAAFGRRPPIVCACSAIIVGAWYRDGDEDAYFGVRLDADMPFRLVLPPTFMRGLIFGDPRQGVSSQALGAISSRLNEANALKNSDSLRISLQRRIVIGSAVIIAIFRDGCPSLFGGSCGRRRCGKQ
jgi:hypothetical protein